MHQLLDVVVIKVSVKESLEQLSVEVVEHLMQIVVVFQVQSIHLTITNNNVKILIK